MEERTYMSIDLKSFYASVECVSRGLDPLGVNLVVADMSRTSKTICLAVSPPLKAEGVSSRPRMFEVEQQVELINARRRSNAPGKVLCGSSHFTDKLAANPNLALDYIIAPPRMSLYMEYSCRIFEIYLKYISSEDIHAYSVDEVFMDVTAYLRVYRVSARELAAMITRDILDTTGITATVGIGSNLYLCKVAMDILAKRSEPDAFGTRVAELTEMSYRRLMWDHRPLTDFWQIGVGYARKLEAHGLFTMGDIARCSLGGPDCFHSEALLYRLFGIKAELLIDHAWGRENCTMEDIKNYLPSSKSVGIGQVLHAPYGYDKALIIVKEMADSLAMELVNRDLVTDQLVLHLGYDKENLYGPRQTFGYNGPVSLDVYGRAVPAHAHGTENISLQTSSARLITSAAVRLYGRIADRRLLIRRINITACRVSDFPLCRENERFAQLDLLADRSREEENKVRSLRLERERGMQRAMLTIRRKYGKGSILRGISLMEGATARDRSKQIGGHRA